MANNIFPNITFLLHVFYLIMEAWLSSFPMIPISLVYSFSGMNDSFMNGVGVTSVKCQISISAGIGGQYLPQYNMFCYMSYRIMEAWFSSFPMIPISLEYSFSGMNDSFMTGVGVPSVKCQISINADIGQYYSVYCSIFCAQLSSHNFKSCFFALTLITMINITMIHTVTCHVCHLWIKPVSLCKYRQGIRKVDGRVRVWSRPGERFAWPACSPGLNPIGQLWDQLSRVVRIRVTIATMQDRRQIVVDELNATSACSAAHIQNEAGVRGCCCGIWWFHPMLMF